MKRAALVLGVMVAAVAFAAEVLTVDALLKDKDKHNEKAVTVKGVVSDYKQRESRLGNPYLTFKLKGENKIANIYMRGKLDGDKAPKDGDEVEVMGVYRKEKKVNDSFTTKDEIDASKDAEKPNQKYGVKITKRKQ